MLRVLIGALDGRGRAWSENEDGEGEKPTEDGAREDGHGVRIDQRWTVTGDSP